MKTRRILAGVVGATMALTMAGAVFAVTNNTQLTQTGTIDPTTFVNQNCTVPDGVSLPGPGEVLWHFVYTAETGTLQGEFAFSDGTIDVASTPQGGAGQHQEWWITTDAGVTLNGDATFTDGTGGNFNLSHVCQGSTPTPTPTATLPENTPTPTLPQNTPTPTLPQTNTIDQSNTGGPGTSLTVVFALILAIAGGLVAYAMRPRRVGNR